MKEIHIWGIKQNNLKNIDVKIPLGQMTVICGPSGSGKSSLAFETLFAEGQRRFIESMSNYTKQFLNKAPKPDIEGVSNIPPAVCLEQKNSVKSSRSNVGTTTELVDYLRLLYEKLGVPYCPVHHVPAEKHSVTEATKKALKVLNGKRGYILTEISQKNRVFENKALLGEILKDGYQRIFIPGKNEIIEISDPKLTKKGAPKQAFYIVIDRLAFNESDEGRLADSINQAYEAHIRYNTNVSARACVIRTTDDVVLRFSEELRCPECDYQPPPLNSRLFSFNSPLGACPTCKGFGNILGLDRAKVIPNPKLSLGGNALHPFSMPSAAEDKKDLLAYCKKAKIPTDIPWEDLSKEQQNMLWEGSAQFMGVKGLFDYLETKKYKMHVRVFISRYRSPSICPDCAGSRLRKDVNTILFRKKNINDLAQQTIEDLKKFFDAIEVTSHEKNIAGEVFSQIRSRLDFLMRVGVGYLTLSRETRTLSGGEYQRLNLANQLGMGLTQTLYVLDEPTVGLHPRDNDRLISILKDLRDLGNTVVLVEHDYDVIRNAENVIEMGPGSGYRGGEVIFSGGQQEFLASTKSVTAPFVNPNVRKAMPKTRPVEREIYKYKLKIDGATGHNLKNLSVEIPLHRMVVVTGVSGSGKSTLIAKTLYPMLARDLDVEFLKSEPCKQLKGSEFVKNVLLVDQSPIGKSARSSPITYIKAYDIIRSLMAQLPEAKARGYTPGTFSLNVDGGRCPACKGTGVEEIDMQFMDNVIIPCDVCDGKKFRNEILEIVYKGKNIHQILLMTVAEAMDFFVAHPPIRKALSVLKEVGLDYLQIGQPSSTLSGGESQRLKLAKELIEVSHKSTLYILDEPTTGLHFREIELLIKVLNQLIDAGGSVIIVEHNLEVISAADYVIDLGPEAGVRGGDIVAKGTPQDIMAEPRSLTGQYLKKYYGLE
ncbi:MAG: excinuclease ABC subunit UvrA [Bdellovibrionaceae bacterium]|nr:excinuclease ABC subunit UvrA [Pseudobdellovibrionaceae bacterium]